MLLSTLASMVFIKLQKLTNQQHKCVKNFGDETTNEIKKASVLQDHNMTDLEIMKKRWSSGSLFYFIKFPIRLSQMISRSWSCNTL